MEGWPEYFVCVGRGKFTELHDASEVCGNANLQVYPNQTSSKSPSLVEKGRYWYAIKGSGVSMEI